MSYYIQDDDEGSLGTAPSEGLTTADTGRPGDAHDVPAELPDGQDAAAESDRGQASDAGVGGAVATDSGAAASGAAAGTQDVPSMDMHDTTDRAKIEGMVAQTRADFPEGSDPVKFEHALRQRFRDSGVELSDERIRALAAE